MTCDPPSDTGSYYPTDNVTLTATAKPGYRFVSWTDNVAEMKNATQKTVVVPMQDYYVQSIKNIEITANFERTFRWEWLATALTALLLAGLALATVMLARRRKRAQAETEGP